MYQVVMIKNGGCSFTDHPTQEEAEKAATSARAAGFTVVIKPPVPEGRAATLWADAEAQSTRHEDN